MIAIFLTFQQVFRANFARMLNQLLHYSLHLIFPAFIAWVFFRDRWKLALLIMLATMFVDVDHLVAQPVFQVDRCSIGFHPLHSYFAIVVYVLLLLPKRSRIIAVGLLLHMMADGLDCFLMK